MHRQTITTIKSKNSLIERTFSTGLDQRKKSYKRKVRKIIKNIYTK